MCRKLICIKIRTVQKTRRPAQPGQPARVRPAATWSEDSGGQTRVSTKLTRPLTGRLSVFGFQTRNTRPEPIVILIGEVLRFSDQIRRDPAVTRWNLGQILTDSARFLSDLDGSSHISARYRRIRSDFS